MGIVLAVACMLLTAASEGFTPQANQSTLTDKISKVTCPTVRLVWEPSYSQVNASSEPGYNTTSNRSSSVKHGLEDGIVVRRKDGTFTMIAAEMYSDPMWIAMQLGVGL